MKAAKGQLEKIVNEEVTLFLQENEIDEGFLDRLKAQGSGMGSRLKSKARGALSKGLEKVGAPMAAGELASGSEDDIAQARSAEASSLLGSHSKKVTNAVARMIKDAEKLDLTKEPQMAKALAAVKGAVTRLDNLLGS
jgi:hypothetical protein